MTLTFSPTHLAKAGLIFALILVIAASRRRTYHPFPTFGPANQVTTFRALLVSLVAGLIGEPARPLLAASVAFLATALDGLDGWMARRSNMASPFGARFDVEVDALLILALAILVWRYDKAGAWVLMSGLLRYLFIIAGWLLPWMGAPLAPTRRAKVIAVMQMGALMLAILPQVARPASTVIAAAGLAALAYSFAVDVWRLRRGI